MRTIHFIFFLFRYIMNSEINCNYISYHDTIELPTNFEEFCSSQPLRYFRSKLTSNLYKVEISKGYTWYSYKTYNIVNLKKITIEEILNETINSNNLQKYHNIVNHLIKQGKLPIDFWNVRLNVYIDTIYHNVFKYIHDPIYKLLRIKELNNFVCLSLCLLKIQSLECSEYEKHKELLDETISFYESIGYIHIESNDYEIIGNKLSDTNDYIVFSDLYKYNMHHESKILVDNNGIVVELKSYSI